MLEFNDAVKIKDNKENLLGSDVDLYDHNRPMILGFFTQKQKLFLIQLNLINICPIIRFTRDNHCVARFVVIDLT